MGDGNSINIFEVGRERLKESGGKVDFTGANDLGRSFLDMHKEALAKRRRLRRIKRQKIDNYSFLG